MIIGSAIEEFSKSTRFQRSYNWEFLLPDIPFGGAGTPGTEIAKYCQSVSFGQYSMEELDSARYGAYQSKYAGKLEVTELVATFLTPIPDIVSDYFHTWRELAVSGEGFFFPKLRYSKDARVILYDRNGSTSAVFKFTGVFPKTLPKFNLDYGTQDIVKLEVSLNVDRVYKEL